MKAFIPNPGFERELMADEQFRQTLSETEAMAKAVEMAQSFAPVDEGDYKAGIKAAFDESGVYLVALWWTSHWIEWGSANNPPFAPLRRGVLGAGLRLEETRAP